MAKKQKSFAEKAEKHGAKDLVHVKYVKSVPSDKEGFWRFNESMISMVKGQNIEVALKEMEDAANLVDIEMPSVEVAEKAPEVAPEVAVEEAPSEETIEAPAEENPSTEEPKTEEVTEEKSE
ncbi:MAG: hypothetical protein HOA15_01830 [Candidatus Marinimicrobia bacterium]|jgi:large subunit ribosomal protein L17|nr:hypothetical protein [Candidatus Neomarinimicrobiota bacterium]MBT3676515.1 hypothetical protein [Candidatus Neomarinimicrobiota bacterium]MBT3763041.1 hypothetical protein [Candidatus Neomarinimicrobiota bacterium]MBT4068728.1 hypothetical protein [Candidatus Neomarinimicrobiota bacterium]MBT4271475.1 hypothetical protein [Candidatus Neomarinimicrobiota bacterium]